MRPKRGGWNKDVQMEINNRGVWDSIVPVWICAPKEQYPEEFFLL